MIQILVLLLAFMPLLLQRCLLFTLTLQSNGKTQTLLTLGNTKMTPADYHNPPQSIGAQM
jgi:hypothetical protein